MTAPTICLMAEKGGVGKTTLALALASALAAKGKSVLCVDADPQASMTQFFLGPERADRLHPANTVAGLFDDALDPSPADVIGATHWEGVCLAPGSVYMKDHNHASPQTLGQVGYALAEFVDEARGDFDAVILDSPPDVSNLPTWSCLMAADWVLVPVMLETFSAQSIAGVDRTLATAQASNRGLRFLGYVVNQQKKISTFHRANEERLRAIHGDRVLDTALPSLMAFSEAQGLRKTVAEHAPGSQADTLSRELCDEVLARIEKRLQARKAA